MATLLSPALEKWIVLGILVLTFALILARTLPIYLIALAAAAVLIAAGLVSPAEALARMISWEALGLYFGFGLLAVALQESHWPEVVASHALQRISQERHVILFLYATSAALSTALPNPVVVLILAPLALDLARRYGSSPLRYLIGVAVASNAVTTVSMVSDLPSIILATSTGMGFLDFYWYKGRLGLGVISIAAVAAAFAVFAFQVRRQRGETRFAGETAKATHGSLVVFALGVIALVVPPLNRFPGLVGLGVGVLSLALLRDRIPRAMREFDWASMLFLVGIFIVAGAVEKVGLLKDLASFIAGLGLTRPVVLVSVITWLSVLFSSFIDNVPYTVLMIPVCQALAPQAGMAPEPLLYGMLVGTGIGGNITPVGATANVLACGILEKNGMRVTTGSYLSVGLPFTVAAVLIAQVLVMIVWM